MAINREVEVFLGLDLGGSGAKALAFDAHGRMLARSKVGYRPVSPAPGWLEFEPEAQWSALVDAVRGCASHLSTRHRVVALAVSAAGEAVIPVDADGRPAAGSIASTDPRGLDQLRAIEKRIGSSELYGITGQAPSGIASVCRAMWLREHRPAVFAKTSRFLLWHDFVIDRLGLLPALDRPNAARTMAYDLASGTWSKPILDAAGLDPEHFARITDPFTPLGELGVQSAAELGLPSRPLVVVGGFDQACASLGAGVTHDGLGFVGSGSVEALAAITEASPQSAALQRGDFSTGPALHDGRFLTVGTNFGAGYLIGWLSALLARPRLGSRSKTPRSGPRPPEDADVMVIPHLMGAASPHRDPLRRAAIVGAGETTSPDDVAMAALEGIAFQLRSMVSCLEAAGIALPLIRNSGGGSQSAASAQLRADVLARPVETLKVTDSAPLGAAIAAAIGAGRYPNVESAVSAMVHVQTIFDPDHHRSAVYDQRYERFRRLDEILADHDRGR